MNLQCSLKLLYHIWEIYCPAAIDQKIKKIFYNFGKSCDMIIERTAKEVIIRLPADVDTNGLQRFVDYLSYKEATASSQAKQSDVDILAKEVKSGWWAKNRAGLLNEDRS